MPGQSSSSDLQGHPWLVAIGSIFLGLILWLPLVHLGYTPKLSGVLHPTQLTPTAKDSCLPIATVDRPAC